LNDDVNDGLAGSDTVRAKSPDEILLAVADRGGYDE